jgi:hypothetical protein
MKPSERIVQIAFERLGHALGSKLRPEHQVEALIRYLDEQHEIERRRRYFDKADMFATQANWSYANAYLEKAGLKSRLVGKDCGASAAEVRAEAEREGLL